jgi:hypothetical protein
VAFAGEFDQLGVGEVLGVPAGVFDGGGAIGVAVPDVDGGVMSAKSSCQSWV